MKKILIFLLLMHLIACSKESPISGIYRTNDDFLFSVITDSTLYLMKGSDTAIIYDLHKLKEFEIEKNIYRIYNVTFQNSLTRNGFESFDFDIDFEYSSMFGGTLIAFFENNENFKLGGYSFHKQQDVEANRIFDIWQDLLINNLETRIFLDLKE